MEKLNEVTFAEIEKLSPLQLTVLLKKLLHLEAFKSGVPLSNTYVSLKIEVRDGGGGRKNKMGGHVFPDVPNAIPLSTSNVLTAEDVAAVKKETKKIYVFIAVNYNDIFNKRHVMQFCASYYPGNNTFVTCRDFSYAN